jgi:hypothetical protein
LLVPPVFILPEGWLVGVLGLPAEVVPPEFTLEELELVEAPDELPEVPMVLPPVPLSSEPLQPASSPAAITAKNMFLSIIALLRETGCISETMQ